MVTYLRLTIIVASLLPDKFRHICTSLPLQLQYHLVNACMQLCHLRLSVCEVSNYFILQRTDLLICLFQIFIDYLMHL